MKTTDETSNNGPVIVSPTVYLFTFLALMLLLLATYILAHIDLGPFNTPVSLFIALVKAMLVVLYFMHLRYSTGLMRIGAVVGVFWLGIMVTLSLTDYLSRNWLPLPSPWPASLH